MLSQWFLVGPGRCGLQLARAMTSAGIRVVGIEARSAAGRRRAHRSLPRVPVIGPDDAVPPTEGVILAVPESALPACAAEMAPRLGAATTLVLHTSGLVPSAALRPLGRRGRHLGSLHPLRSFPTATGPAVDLHGVTAAVEGEAAAVREATALARALGMRPVEIAPEAKPLYHAGAAIAANLTHTLVVSAKAILVRAGFSENRAAAALRPLVGGAVEAALAASGIERLTGPVARGDAWAVKVHLAALPEDAASAYRAVGTLALRALASQGLVSESQLQELGRALTLLN